MPTGDENTVTYEAFCPRCDAERTVMRTVPWQDDACVQCGASVDGDG